MPGVAGQHIYAQRLASGRRTLVSNLSSTDPNWSFQSTIDGSFHAWYGTLGVWSPDCRQIAFLGAVTSVGSGLYTSDLGVPCG
jgi:hypothetical protein